jgi:hypothetical protein
MEDGSVNDPFVGFCGGGGVEGKALEDLAAGVVAGLYFPIG